MKALKLFLVLTVLIIAFVVRLYRIDNPVADWHSWRQADTAAVARNFVKSNFNPLFPQSDSLLALNEHGLKNPNRYFINEFPLYNAIVALAYKQFGINTVYARMVSILFATSGTLFLYLLTKELFNFKVAILSMFLYAVNPFNVYYGRVIMPDPAFVSLSITGLYFCIKWLQSKKMIFGIIFAITFALALLVKPYSIFLLIPISYSIISNWGNKVFKSPQFYLVTAISFIPLLLWRYHVFLHPEGTFATSWLFNATDVRFSGAFFRWIILERLNNLIFAVGGFALIIFGLAKVYQLKNGLFILAWFMSTVMYITVFAMGNVTHDYYQLPIIPVGSILMAIGVFALIDMGTSRVSKIFNTFIAFSLILFMLAFGWYQAKDFFNVNNQSIVEAGTRVDQVLPKDSLVIAPYQGDPAFLYQTNRYGYPVVERSLELYLDEGIRYLVSVDTKDEGIMNLEKHCKVLEKADNYIIIEMFKECIGK